MGKQSQQPAADYLIIGDSVTGAYAAALLSAQEHAVTFLRHPSIYTAGAATWLSHASEELLSKVNLSLDQVSPAKVDRCLFYSYDMSRTIEPQFPEQRPRIVQEQRLIDQLLSSCSSTVTTVPQLQVERLELGEDLVVAQDAQGNKYEGRFLLLTGDMQLPLMDQVGLSSQSVRAGGIWHVSYRCNPAAQFEPGRVDYVLGIANSKGHGYRICFEDAQTIGLNISGSVEDAAREVVKMSELLAREGLLGVDWTGAVGEARPHRSPAGVCLEMDTHVAKRALAIGKIGGFVASFTNECLYPGLWSAQIACDVLLEALSSASPQDKLREFEHRWRIEMADYLRSPNTDAQSLLPLVFSNQQMSNRMLESLQYGINF